MLVKLPLKYHMTWQKSYNSVSGRTISPNLRSRMGNKHLWTHFWAELLFYTLWKHTRTCWLFTVQGVNGGNFGHEWWAKFGLIWMMLILILLPCQQELVSKSLAKNINGIMILGRQDSNLNLIWVKFDLGKIW